MDKESLFTTICIVDWDVHHALNKTAEKCNERLKDLFKEDPYTFRVYRDSLHSDKDNTET